MDRLRTPDARGSRRAAGLMAASVPAARLHWPAAGRPTRIRSQEDVVRLLGPFMERLPHEEMWAVYLSSANGVIEKARVSQGGVTHLVVD